MVRQASGDVAAHVRGVKHTGYDYEGPILVGLCQNNRCCFYIGRLFSPIVSTIGLSADQ